MPSRIIVFHPGCKIVYSSLRSFRGEEFGLSPLLGAKKKDDQIYRKRLSEELILKASKKSRKELIESQRKRRVKEKSKKRLKVEDRRKKKKERLSKNTKDHRKTMKKRRQ